MSRVAIIGGGPGGFGAARALAGEKKFKMTIYERKDQPGGVWVYDGTGPIYRDLDSNIFKELMEYKDRPFPEGIPRFVPREDILKYLQSYSQEVLEQPGVRVQWGATVTKITKRNDIWLIDVNGRQDEAEYVLLASGHFDFPSYPAIPGLLEFQAKFPERVLHSRHYVTPDRFRNQKTLVIGNASSGVDMTIQILSVTSPVTVSRRHEYPSDKTFENSQDVIWKPEATSLNPDTGEILFSDGTSDTFDAIVLGTGYLYKAPFLEEFNAEQKIKLLDAPKYQRMQNLHKYMFYIGDPSMATVIANQQIVPNPIAESQAAVIARVWSGKLSLPSTHEMLAEEKKLVEERGSGRNYLLLGYPADVNYMHSLCDWAETVADQGGFFAQRWGPEKCEMRKTTGEAKLEEYKHKLEESRRKRNAQLKAQL